MPSFQNSRKRQKKKISVEKPWKDARLKPSETTATRNKRALEIIKILKRYYPDAKCSLDYSNELELLIATMLSAQCTDKRVNMVTPALFSKYKTAKDFSNAALDELEQMIRSTGFYKNKAKNIIGATKAIVDEHSGQVPRTMESLSALAGVGRKTANVVLGNAFGVPGMVVDTHVTRLSNRLGLAKGEDAVKLEKQLEDVIPRKYWVDFSHLLIEHGRRTCVARKPKCEICFLSDLCPKIGV